MNKDEILIKIQGIFRDVFDDDTLVITPETTAKDVVGWDSLEQINLISSIEDEFEIEFDMEELLAFKSVGTIINSIETKLN